MTTNNSNLNMELYKHKACVIKDNTYIEVGYKIPYHYHEKGFLTFLIEKGVIKVTLNGKAFTLEEGDIVNFEPFCPYGYEIAAANTQIKEMYTDFEQVGNYFELPEPVDCEEIRKEDVSFVVTKDSGRHIFQHEGISFYQKTARYQLGGLKEIWEYRIDKGYKLNFNAECDEEAVYFVRSGELEVISEGEVFKASKEGQELIRIPANTAYSMKAITDESIVIDFNVTSHLFRLLEMVEAAEDYFSEKLDDKEYVNYLYEVNKLHNFAGFAKAE